MEAIVIFILGCYIIIKYRTIIDTDKPVGKNTEGIKDEGAFMHMVDNIFK